MLPPRRPRAERRELARDAAKLARERVRLARLEPGGAPERPIDVPSASVIEVRARGMPCAACGGEVRVEDHEARTLAGVPLRLVRVLCPQCGGRRIVHFQVRALN
jgi:hypothetical protein